MNKKILTNCFSKKARTSKMISNLFVVLFLTFSSMSLAQTGFDDDVDDETVAASIDSGVLLLSVVGTALGYFLIRKSGKIEIKTINKNGSIPKQ